MAVYLPVIDLLLFLLAVVAVCLIYLAYEIGRLKKVEKRFEKTEKKFEKEEKSLLRYIVAGGKKPQKRKKNIKKTKKKRSKKKKTIILELFLFKFCF